MGTLNRIKTFLTPRNFGLSDESEHSEPMVGFNVVYNCATYELIIKIIGARNLPVQYGTQKPQGYFVKVKVFPGRDKFETEIKKEPNPGFNQEFVFPLNKNPKEPFTGRFVVVTLYALLDSTEKKPNLLKARASFRNSINEFIGKKASVPDTIERRKTWTHAGNRISLNNSRTIGAVTYSIDSSVFKQIVKGKSMATPDIWRQLKNISSGVQIISKESRKGSVEVTISYSNSEDGKNDMIQISLSRLRCSMQTMQEHEKLGGSLYLKMTVFEYDVRVAAWKSDRFEPTISMKIEPNTATLQALVNNYNLDNVLILIRIMCRNMLQKKFLLGKIEIKKDDALWKAIISEPTVPITNMIDFI